MNFIVGKKNGTNQKLNIKMNFENLTIWHWIIHLNWGSFLLSLGYYWALPSKKNMDHDGQLKLCQDKFLN